MNIFLSINLAILAVGVLLFFLEQRKINGKLFKNDQVAIEGYRTILQKLDLKAKIEDGRVVLVKKENTDVA